MDYDKLAKKLGGSSQATTQEVDYDALANNIGASVQTQAPQMPNQVDAYKQQAESDSFGENLLAGIGGGMTGMYLGAKDLLGQASEDEIKQYKMAMEGLNSTAGGFIGDIVGQSAIMLPAGVGAMGAGVKYIPKVGQALTTLGGRTALASLGGATQSAFIPTTEDESRLGNMALGGIVGAGANQLLERGAKAVQKFALNRAQQPAITNNVKVQIDNYLSSQGIDISQLSPSAKAKAQQFAYDALKAEVNAKPAVNQAILESLPVPIQGTKGQIGQDYVQQQNEGVLADTFFGGELKNRFEQQQTQLGQNLDNFIEKSRGLTKSIKETGEGLQGQALKLYNLAKKETSNAYKFAESSAGDTLGKPSDNLIQWLERNKGYQDVGGVVTKAKELGVIKLDKNGRLVAGDAPLRNFYELRKDISRLSKNNGAFAEAKTLIDDTFDAYGGDAYRAAATLRRQQGVTFESGAKSVRDLVGLKKGTSDQLINREDVFNKVMINGNRDDIINIKKLMLSGTRAEKAEGAQQLRNLKGQTLQYLKDSAVTDAGGKTQFNLTKFEQAYNKIGEENLTEVLGSKGKKQLDDFMKAAVIINRKQPSSAGGSQTASRLANMMGSIFKIVEKLPVAGAPASFVGTKSIQAIQASGATSNQMKALAKKAIDKTAGKQAAKISNSPLGSILKTTAVGTGQNLNE